jgi:hypothetical protein
MNSLPILIIGIPAVVAVLAAELHERQQVEEPEVEYVDCWQGLEDARTNHPPLAEMEVR